MLWDLEVFIMSLTLCAAGIGWCTNLTLKTWERMKESKIAKYKDALETFYWPLLLHFSYMNQMRERDPAGFEASRLTSIKIIDKTIGRIVPRKNVSQPLVALYLNLRSIKCGAELDVQLLEFTLLAIQHAAFKLSRTMQILIGQRTRHDIVCPNIVVSECVQEVCCPRKHSDVSEKSEMGDDFDLEFAV